MTFLELVNGVLVRLREEQVSSVDADDYTSLIAAYVNDAKIQVEEAWNWQALRDSITINTAASQAQYALTDWGSRVAIEEVWDTTNSVRMLPATNEWIRRNNNSSSVIQTAPTHWAVSGVDSNGDVNLTFYPTPDDTYAVEVYGWKKQATLVSGTDELAVPFQPVLMLAVALAARERGEVGGQTAAELFLSAKRALNDAIAWDVSLSPTQTDWYVT